MSDNKDKLKKMYAALPPSRKESLKRSISEKYHITTDSFKNNWIYGGKIPEEYFAEVYESVKLEAKEYAGAILQLTT